MRPNLVLCLGNEVLSDDSFGYKICQMLCGRPEPTPDTDIIFSALGGFNLIDLLKDRNRVLIVDSIISGQSSPGTLHFFEMGYYAPSKNLTCSHQINLPTAISLGRQLGCAIPDSIDVLAVEAEDIQTLGENLTPAVEAALDPAIARILNWVSEDWAAEANYKRRTVLSAMIPPAAKEISDGIT